MSKMRAIILSAIILIFAYSLLPQLNLAQGLEYPREVTRLKTIAGDLQITLLAQGKWCLKLADKIILQEDNLQMSVLKYINQKITPFDEVVVLHRPEGSYCNGGTFWFLGLKHDGTYQLSTGIGECFAQTPVVIAGKNMIKVTVKGGYGNNRIDEPYLRGGTWFYKNGRVIKYRAGRP